MEIFKAQFSLGVYSHLVGLLGDRRCMTGSEGARDFSQAHRGRGCLLVLYSMSYFLNKWLFEICLSYLIVLSALLVKYMGFFIDYIKLTLVQVRLPVWICLPQAQAKENSTKHLQTANKAPMSTKKPVENF